MTDLIDRQAAIDALHGYFDGMLETDTWSPCDVYGLIEILPSADAVEVVRCYECVWWDTCPSSRIAPNFHKCKRVWRMSMPSDGFCSYGEREKENKK